MKVKNTEDLESAYENVEHWPPFTYRDYPSVIPEKLRSFLDFLETENKNSTKKELQPWIPFCDSKCTFCYFPTDPFSKREIKRYLPALKKALMLYAKTKYIKSSEFNEIYFGGGTPSVLSSEQIADLLSYCEKNFNITEDRMVKITGCTHNLNEKKLKSMSDYKVNQLDLGIQTFNDKIRKTLNLRDNSHKVEQTIRTARKLGLYVSIDLIYNLPGQTIDIWRDDLRKALKLDVESVDCYPLDVHLCSKLAKQLKSGEVPSIGNTEIEKKMYLEAYKLFAESGYKPACHNRFSRIEEDLVEPCFEIVGSGAGFFMGYLGNYSYTDVESTKEYIDTVKAGRFPIAKLSVSSQEEEMKKTMMRLYIRLSVDKSEFRRRFGRLPEEVFASAIDRLKKKSLIEVDEKEIRLTKLGDIWRFNIAWEFGGKPKLDSGVPNCKEEEYSQQI